MTTQSAEQLQTQHCKPCEGGVEPFSEQEARDQVKQLESWSLTDDGKHIRRKWKMKDFMAGMAFLNQVADLAQQEDHHPDMCIKNYKEVTIELSTHAIKGLSENDFILAAKIDRLSQQQG